MATKFHPDLLPWPPSAGAPDREVAAYRKAVLTIAGRRLRRIVRDCIAALFCLFAVALGVPAASVAERDVLVIAVVVLTAVTLVGAIALITRACSDLAALAWQLTETR